MRHAWASLVVLLTGAAVAEPPVQFPGTVSEARAPNSDARVTYFDPGENSEGLHEYRLRLEYPDGHAEEIDSFMRSVDVSWSPSGAALYVTDFVSSNVADCYVITPGAEKTQKVSLTNIITGGRYPAPAWALQHSAHGYVKCDGWIEPDKLRFVLAGDGGDSPNGFHYAFVYDVKSGVAKQVPASPRHKRP